MFAFLTLDFFVFELFILYKCAFVQEEKVFPQ
jgi:hypothetical protein